MTKLCPTFTSHVFDDKMEYTYTGAYAGFLKGGGPTLKFGRYERKS